MADLTIDFSQNQTVSEFVASEAVVAGIMGPFGCIAGDTLVLTEHGAIPISDIDRPMRVLSWNEKTSRFELAQCGGAFPKGKDCLCRVTTQQGEFVAAGFHRVLDASGNYRRVDSLARGQSLSLYSDSLRATASEPAPLTSHADDPHLMQTILDSMERYAASARRYGQRLLGRIDIGQAFAPSPAGVQRSFPMGGLASACNWDDLRAQLQEHIHQGQCSGPSRIDGFSLPFERLDRASAGHAGRQPSSHIAVTIRRSLQSRLTTALHRIIGQSSSYSRSSLRSLSERTIISVERLSVKEDFWDMQVLDTNNYVTADGTIHHNSGKSVGLSAWCFQIGMTQEPAEDGVRYSRIAVIRNTTPELKSTTIKTVTDQFPEGPHGRVIYSSPITYHVRFPRTPGNAGIDMELIFIALDSPKDVRKLLSLELTAAWVNEARETAKPVIDALTGRIGRYPAGKKGKATKIAIGMDTNPPDEYSWWFKSFEGHGKPLMFKTSEGKMVNLTWKGFQQPPAVLELANMGKGVFESIEDGYDYVYDEAEVLPAADTFWGINPEAENLINLPPTYYANLVLEKSKEFIQVYAQGRYGYVQEGKAVVPEFSASSMVLDFPVMEDRDLIIGIDIGGGTLQPAAAILQRHPLGTWLVQGECVAADMGVDRFADVLKQYLDENFKGLNVAAVYTDPAAEVRDEIFEVKVNNHLKAKGFPVRSAPTQDWKARRLAIAQPCNRFINGKPGLLVHRTRCRMIADGLKGKWNFRKLQLVGVDAYAETPMKNEYSHPCEALGYGLSGGGENKVVQANKTKVQEDRWRTGWTSSESYEILS